MYGYAEYSSSISKDEILKRISQEEIFKIVFGFIPVENEYIVSPFREDDTIPGCWFSWNENKLLFKDFGDSEKIVRDCFQAVMDYYNLSLNDACTYINNEFKLGLGDGDNVKPVIYNRKKSIKKKLKSKTDIKYKPKFFTNDDRIYWSKYGITKDNLIEDKVFPLRWYKFFSKKGREVIIRPFDICYAYSDFDDNRVKIYRPHAEKSGKWLTNCSQNDIGSINHLPISGNTLIITKSYKDCRILRNLGYNSVWFQNEGMLPNDESIISLCKRFDKIVVLFDNDSAGIKAGIVVTNIINSHFPLKARELYLPEILLKDYGIKDSSDLVEKKGLKELIQFLNLKI